MGTFGFLDRHFSRLVDSVSQLRCAKESRGLTLKEDLERKGAEDMQALLDQTAKVKAELQASKEMEDRLQGLWHSMSECHDPAQVLAMWNRDGHSDQRTIRAAKRALVLVCAVFFSWVKVQGRR